MEMMQNKEKREQKIAKKVLFVVKLSPFINNLSEVGCADFTKKVSLHKEKKAGKNKQKSFFVSL